VAVEFYGVNLGQHASDVVRGTSTNGTAVEVTIDLARVTNMTTARMLVEYIVNAMENAGSSQKFPTRIPADGL